MDLTTGAQIAKKAVESLKKKVTKEVVRRAKREVAKKAVDSVSESSESRSVAQVGKLAQEGIDISGRRISGQELPVMKDGDVFRNGPQDILFDLNKNPISPDVVVFDESKFRPGIDRISGRKPTPDAVIVDNVRKEVCFVEDKRPSECAHNSWLHSYDNDPFGEYRKEQALLVKDGVIPREKAEARIIIREHDLHMGLRPKRWQAPDGIPPDFSEKLQIRIPDVEEKRIEALVEELRETGREPEVVNDRGIASIRYSIEKPTWDEKVVGRETGKTVYELDANKNADGTRNRDRILLNEHPLPQDSIFKVKMAGGVEATFETDSQGRVCKVHVEEVRQVSSEERLRDGNRTAETTEIKNGLETDDGGHLLGDLFGGSSDQINLVPMDSEVNRHGDWRLLEAKINATLNGPPPRTVSDFTVTIRYDGDTARPSSFKVSYRVEGDPKPKVVVISNQTPERTVKNVA